LQKLVRQVAERSVDLNAIKTGFLGVLSGLPILIDHPWNLIQIQWPRRLKRYAAIASKLQRHAVDRNRRRCHRQRTVMKERMRNTAAVP
jgi:hypothetical protein